MVGSASCAESVKVFLVGPCAVISSTIIFHSTLARRPLQPTQPGRRGPCERVHVRRRVGVRAVPEGEAIDCTQLGRHILVEGSTAPSEAISTYWLPPLVGGGNSPFWISMPRPVVSVQTGDRGERAEISEAGVARQGWAPSGCCGRWATMTSWAGLPPESGCAAAGWAAGCAGLTGTTATVLRGPRTEGSLPCPPSLRRPWPAATGQSWPEIADGGTAERAFRASFPRCPVGIE